MFMKFFLFIFPLSVFGLQIEVPKKFICFDQESIVVRGGYDDQNVWLLINDDNKSYLLRDVIYQKTGENAQFGASMGDDYQFRLIMHTLNSDQEIIATLYKQKLNDSEQTLELNCLEYH